MQDPTRLEIESLLVELALCINDLQSFHEQLIFDDIKLAEISLKKLEELIFGFNNRRDVLNLSMVEH